MLGKHLMAMSNHSFILEKTIVSRTQAKGQAKNVAANIQPGDFVRKNWVLAMDMDFAL